MPTKITHYSFILMILFLNACGTPGDESLAATILPVACQVQMGQQLALTLDGQIPANTQIQWSATVGEVVWTGQGLTAVFLAPNIPGDSVISVSFVSGTPVPFTASRSCMVTSNQTPINPVLPDVSSASGYTIVLSEIMGNPCGSLDARKFNQYVELYNFGDQAVDVGGWWLFDEGQKGTPDRLAAWSTRSTFQFDSSLTTNSTVIPPHGYAVILSPIYTEGDIEYRMPYLFPANTVILTAETGQTLGDDFFGIISNEDGYDTLTLYVGSEAVIDQVVDTYGTPAINGPYTVNIDDDHLDNAPLYLSECRSAERINPRLPDTESNWVTVRGGTPGDGPYQ